MTKLQASDIPDPFGEAIELPEPSWIRCPRCSREVAMMSGKQCFECNSIDRRARIDRAYKDEQERALVKAFERAGIREKYRWITPDHPELARRLGVGDPEQLALRIEGLLTTQLASSIITITGGTGAGKTHLANAMAIARLSVSLYVTASGLCASDSQHALGSGEAPLIERAYKARILVIDELKLPALAARKEMLERLIFDRVDLDLLTIITHGWEEKQILSQWGAGMHRRMYVDGEHVDLDPADRSAA